MYVSDECICVRAPVHGTAYIYIERMQIMISAISLWKSRFRLALSQVGNRLSLTVCDGTKRNRPKQNVMQWNWNDMGNQKKQHRLSLKVI